MKISEFISEGREQAISLEQLARATGLTERAVKREVLNDRLSGSLIVSGPSGYYIATDIEDIREFVIVRKSYIKTAAEALRPFVEAVKKGVL